MTDAPKFTFAEKAREAEREVAMRRQVYGKHGPIAGGRLKQVEIMREIAREYRALAEKDPPAYRSPRIGEES
jgi:predicted Ser/Thr protein kinase